MPRFEVKDIEGAAGYYDPDGDTEASEYQDLSYAAYLVDNKNNTIVFVDWGTEPEDATLYRSYRGLVDLLNKVAGEHDES